MEGNSYLWTREWIGTNNILRKTITPTVISLSLNKKKQNHTQFRHTAFQARVQRGRPGCRQATKPSDVWASSVQTADCEVYCHLSSKRADLECVQSHLGYSTSCWYATIESWVVNSCQATGHYMQQLIHSAQHHSQHGPPKSCPWTP